MTHVHGAGYKTYSHYKALKGARQLLGLFAELDTANTARVTSPTAEGSTAGRGAQSRQNRHVKVINLYNSIVS